ncbi:fructosamine kinase family protein [Kallotenue papyrolyticum]|uniref:fructosamine kinase family protein n=1 Tax=Kallotenue papyrolyticum TaxID=1325125 RepID=UPI000492B239|nr:fructosamine kinase family protein [Kallotenue papyrolyticum]
MPPPRGWPTPLEAEARGLHLLAATGVLRVPAVIGHLVVPQGELLISEWIETDARGNQQAAAERLGAELAALHRHSAPCYGLDHHNYCGATPQRNTPYRSWLAFWRDERLAFQRDLALQRGLLPPQRQRRLERLMERLDLWIADALTQPALLHGDLWSGNWLIDTQGRPVLIDPAVSYGDREAELALCDLFGGFPETFWRAYAECWPLPAGAAERRPLYQLYHLLNHLNLFGESYGAQVDAVLRRYVG